MTSIYELVGAAWDDAVDDNSELCRCCGHDLGVHAPGLGCDECSCVYGFDGWALDGDGEAR